MVLPPGTLRTSIGYILRQKTTAHCYGFDDVERTIFTTRWLCLQEFKKRLLRSDRCEKNFPQRDLKRESCACIVCMYLAAAADFALYR